MDYKKFPDDFTSDTETANQGVLKFIREGQTRVNIQLKIDTLKQIKTCYMCNKTAGDSLLAHIIEVAEKTNDFDSCPENEVAKAFWENSIREDLKKTSKDYFRSIGYGVEGGRRSADSRSKNIP